MEAISPLSLWRTCVKEKKETKKSEAALNQVKQLKRAGSRRETLAPRRQDARAYKSMEEENELPKNSKGLELNTLWEDEKRRKISRYNLA